MVSERFSVFTQAIPGLAVGKLNQDSWDFFSWEWAHDDFGHRPLVQGDHQEHHLDDDQADADN
jgi:hypothetical protein